MTSLLESVKVLVKEAGDEILNVYRSESIRVEYKYDRSFLSISIVTQADMAAHTILVNGLSVLADYPILSEEGAQVSWAERQKWDQYWLIDPLDGTKEFVERNDEFTVNVALIKNHRPVLGVVYAPVLDLWYYAARGQGAYKCVGGTTPVKISARDDCPNSLDGNGLNIVNGEGLNIVSSRSRSSVEFEQFMRSIPNANLVPVGSSLKLCMVADGQADLHPKLMPTCEWDTAAAHIVVEEAGGCIVTWPEKEELLYNDKESLLNPSFMVSTSAELLTKL